MEPDFAVREFSMRYSSVLPKIRVSNYNNRAQSSRLTYPLDLAAEHTLRKNGSP